jgi:hypothetical protein
MLFSSSSLRSRSLFLIFCVVVVVVLLSAQILINQLERGNVEREEFFIRHGVENISWNRIPITVSLALLEFRRLAERALPMEWIGTLDFIHKNVNLVPESGYWPRKRERAHASRASVHVVEVLCTPVLG